MMHDAWTDRLSEYLDGDLAPDETAALEAHLGECLACRDVLAGLRDVARATAGLRDQPPARDLWPGILDRISEPAPAVTGADVLPMGARGRIRRVSFSVTQLLAASITMMAVSGGAVWLALRADAVPAPATVATADPAAPTTMDAAAAVLISNVEKEYRPVMDQLQVEFDSRRDQLDPETVRVVEDNLRIIDQAIAEARAALSNDPANGYLYHHLDQTMTQKVDLLRRAAGASLVST